MFCALIFGINFAAKFFTGNEKLENEKEKIELINN